MPSEHFGSFSIPRELAEHVFSGQAERPRTSGWEGSRLQYRLGRESGEKFQRCVKRVVPFVSQGIVNRLEHPKDVGPFVVAYIRVSLRRSTKHLALS